MLPPSDGVALWRAAVGETSAASATASPGGAAQQQQQQQQQLVADALAAWREAFGVDDATADGDDAGETALDDGADDDDMWGCSEDFPGATG